MNFDDYQRCGLNLEQFIKKKKEKTTFILDWWPVGAEYHEYLSLYTPEAKKSLYILVTLNPFDFNV